ncbi:MAG: helix-turn-helix transcriptional regulator [Planctomycetota bacterium]|jgi:AraC-like DNA-binding protein
MKSFTAVRRLPIEGQESSARVCLHHNGSFTNAEKVWDRYAGCFVLRGTGTYRNWEGQIETVSPGDFVHHLPDRYHHIERCAEGWEEYSLAMDAGLYARFHGLGLIDDRQGVQHLGPDTVLENAFVRLAEEIQYGGAAGACILAIGTLLVRIQELAEAKRVRTQEEALIETARQRLERDWQAAIPLEALAEECGFSYACFRRLFRLQVGAPPAAYRNEQRLTQAKLMLTYNRVRIADVAVQLGYADQFVFSRQFKKRFGTSPKQYNLQHCMS